MAQSAKTSPRRRKIFPHLDAEGKVKKSESSSPSASSNNNGSGAKSSKSETSSSYDNAKSKRSKKDKKTSNSATTAKPTSTANDEGSSLHHLLPLPLTLTVLVCSGLFWMACFRDVMATGKPILDTLGMLWGQEDGDANFLEYTKATQFYDDTQGWKSKQGGLSTILTFTTDANNMGGLFVHKLAGMAGLAYHSTKLLPIVFHTPPRYDARLRHEKGQLKWIGASWNAGHFDPLLALGMIGDVCVATFYLNRLDDMKNAGAGGLGLAFVLTSLVEAFIFGMYLLLRKRNHFTVGRPNTTTTASAASGATYRIENDPKSLPSRIVARTTFIVSSLTLLVSLRDLLFPGNILPFVPRDDIYLEWTGAFLHSPPPDTVEADEHGLEAPLFAGDKFVAQQLGMYLALGAFLKLCSSWGWRKGHASMGSGTNVANVDRRGVVTSKMIWRAQALGDFGVLMMLRLFTPAAKTASLDLRWHLMLVAYEGFILFLYGFW